jgi:hypothetical protein
MKPNASKFIVKVDSTKNLNWANYLDRNILLKTQYGGGKPWADLTDPVIQYVSSAAPSLNYGRTPLTDFLQGTGRVREVDSDIVKWKLKGTGELVTYSLENNHLGNSTPGIQGSDVILTLDRETYVIGDVLATDIAKDIQLRVTEVLGRFGQGYRFRTMLVDRNPNNFFPPELLKAGIKWIKIDSVYGEASWDYGSFYTTGMSWIEFQSNLTDVAKQVKITNKAHQLQLTLFAANEKNEVLKNFPPQTISWIEAEFEAQMKWEKELRNFYGRSDNGRTIDMSSGYKNNIGPGLLEFLEDGGNMDRYPVYGNSTRGNFKRFKDFLTSIWFDRVAPNQRNVVVYTGQMGLEQMNEWLTAEYGASSITSDFNTFVSKSGTTYGDGYTGLIYKTAYFTEIQLFPFGKIRFEHWPILDSTYLNGSVVHPESGMPLSSYEYIILDTGLGNGAGSNIELLNLKDSRFRTYICGVWSPAGPINSVGGRNQAGFIAVNGERAYTLKAGESHGLRVKDVTLTAWYKPAVDY